MHNRYNHDLWKIAVHELRSMMEHCPTPYRFSLAPPLLSMRFCLIYRKRGRSEMKVKTLGARSIVIAFLSPNPHLSGFSFFRVHTFCLHSQPGSNECRAIPPPPRAGLRFANSFAKRRRAPSANYRHGSRPPFLMLGVKGYDELSALHLDGHGFCQLEHDRSLGREPDVLLSR